MKVRKGHATWLELALIGSSPSANEASVSIHAFVSHTGGAQPQVLIEVDGRVVCNSVGARTLFNSVEAAEHFLGRLGIRSFQIERHPEVAPPVGHADAGLHLTRRGLEPMGMRPLHVPG